MHDFTKTANVANTGDGYVRLTVDRQYDDGVRYRSVLLKALDLRPQMRLAGR